MNVRERVREAVDGVVAKLFTNGQGNEAYRLVLKSLDNRDLGGWGRLPLRDQILAALEPILADPLAAGEEVRLRRALERAEKRIAELTHWLESRGSYVKRDEWIAEVLTAPPSPAAQAVAELIAAISVYEHSPMGLAPSILEALAACRAAGLVPEKP